MKKLVIYVLCVLFVLTSFSTIVMADEDDTDISWGHDHESPWDDYIGMRYVRENFDEPGELTTFFNVYKHFALDSVFRNVVDGAYVEDGQSVTTTLGTDLGVRYSPFVFELPDEYFGLRVSDYQLSGDNYAVNLDGTYIIMSHTLNPGDYDFVDPQDWNRTGGDNIDEYSDGRSITQHDYAVNASGNVDLLNFDATLLRYINAQDDNFYNYGATADAEIIDGLVLEGLYAGYQEDNGMLYEIAATMDLDDNLTLRGAHRDSRIDGDDIEVDSVWNYIDRQWQYGPPKRDYVFPIWDRGFNFAAGLTYGFEIDQISNFLEVDFETTSPLSRDNENPHLISSLYTEAMGFAVNNYAYLDLEDPVYTFRNSVETPSVDIEIADGNEISFWGRTSGYIQMTDDGRDFDALGSINMSTTQDIWRLAGVSFDAFALAEVGEILREYDIAGTPRDEIEDLFKYGLMARYDAPNGIKFRLQYFNSAEFDEDADARDRDGFREPWSVFEIFRGDFRASGSYHDVYDDYTFYRNDNYGQGIRAVVGIPIR